MDLTSMEGSKKSQGKRNDNHLIKGQHWERTSELEAAMEGGHNLIVLSVADASLDLLIYNLRWQGVSFADWLLLQVSTPLIDFPIFSSNGSPSLW